MASYLQQLPLYKGHGIEQQDCFKFRDGHRGLLFDRFFGAYTAKWEIDKAVGKTASKTDNGCGESVAPMSWLNGETGSAAQITRHVERQVSLVLGRSGGGLSCKTDWHFVTGVGEAHPLENGFAWHHSLGAPYLPGSSIKGMLRGYLSEWAPTTFSADEILAIFGNEREAGDGEQCAGEFIFFDALPLMPPSLVMDIMTPHGGAWYANGASDAGSPSAVPADWHDPLPISFLVVQKARFLFTVAPRSGSEHPLTDKLLGALKDALQYIGAGAKTAAGYGQMSPLPETDRHSWKKLVASEREETLKNQLAVAPIGERLTRALERALEAAEAEKTNKTIRENLVCALDNARKEMSDLGSEDVSLLKELAEKAMVQFQGYDGVIKAAKKVVNK